MQMKRKRRKALFNLIRKTQLKLAISRIKLQKNKKDNNIKNNKREIAELLKNGKDESARIKVENIIREDFVIEAYEILELFCELLLARLGVIQISKYSLACLFLIS